MTAYLTASGIWWAFLSLAMALCCATERDPWYRYLLTLSLAMLAWSCLLLLPPAGAVL